MGSQELFAETERKVKSCSIATSFPLTILRVLLRPEQELSQLSTKAGNRQGTKKKKK